MTSCYKPYDSHNYWDWLNNTSIHDYKDKIYVKYFLVPMQKFYWKKYKSIIEGVFTNYKLELDKYSHIEQQYKRLEQYIKDKHKL